MQGKNDAELVEALLAKIDQLFAGVEVVPTLSANGVSKADFDKALETLPDLVYNDQTTPGNPRQPRLEEIRTLLSDQF